jgi:hypothetical protein
MEGKTKGRVLPRGRCLIGYHDTKEEIIVSMVSFKLVGLLVVAEPLQ